MTQSSPFCYFRTSPEVIRLAVMLYIPSCQGTRPWHGGDAVGRRVSWRSSWL